MNNSTPANRIALITGGSRGLGRNAALHLARSGVDIILTYNSSQAEAGKVVEEIKQRGRRAVALQLDTGNVSSFPKFRDELKAVLSSNWKQERLDYLLNNAGVGRYAPLTETSEAQFDELMNVHFKGVLFLTQTLLPLINDGGRILNISTGLARFTLPGYGAYASMKGAIEVFTKYLAKELGPRQITANVLAPGAIETDFGGGRVRDDAALNQHVASLTALGRVGQPDDIGGAIAAILAPGSGWINAQRIEASGGMLL
jgi:NAD(P)-dependent dehydrogenase (short-subunit alcohol dehydrogenase family)